MSKAHKTRKQRQKEWELAAHVKSPPGSIQAPPDAPNSVITAIAYNGDEVVEKTIENPQEITQYLAKFPVTWINVEGLADVEKVKAIGDIFHIHSLVLEDVMAFHQRAKVEQYDDHYFIIAHMLERQGDEVATEQLNIFLGQNFVVTFQNGPIDCLDPARDRVRKGIGHVRSSGPDYLAYSLLDSLIDNYFPILESYGETLEDLEDEIIDVPTRQSIGRIHLVKRNLLVLRRSIWPLREAINTLLRDSPPLFAHETIVHLRDCYDHAVQIIDFVETYRELTSDLMDVYLSSISNRMNEVMKVLTIITTLCVPPTLVAGIYGMNFNYEKSPYNMPELNWYFGYPYALALMVVLGVGTLAFMWWKGWLGVFKPGHHHANVK